MEDRMNSEWFFDDLTNSGRIIKRDFTLKAGSESKVEVRHVHGAVYVRV
jgi:hypothetical protein